MGARRMPGMLIVGVSISKEEPMRKMIRPKASASGLSQVMWRSSIFPHAQSVGEEPTGCRFLIPK